jgi:hypothetical protein
VPLQSRRSSDRYSVRLAPYLLLQVLGSTRSVSLASKPQICRVRRVSVRNAISVRPQPIPSKCVAMHHPTITMTSALCYYIHCDSV